MCPRRIHVPPMRETHMAKQRPQIQLYSMLTPNTSQYQTKYTKTGICSHLCSFYITINRTLCFVITFTATLKSWQPTRQSAFKLLLTNTAVFSRRNKSVHSELVYIKRSLHGLKNSLCWKVSVLSTTARQQRNATVNINTQHAQKQTKYSNYNDDGALIN